MSNTCTTKYTHQMQKSVQEMCLQKILEVSYDTLS